MDPRRGAHALLAIRFGHSQCRAPQLPDPRGRRMVGSLFHIGYGADRETPGSGLRHCRPMGAIISPTLLIQALGWVLQQEALRWWDYWLKGQGDGPEAWPRLRLWLREFDPPMEVLDTRKGEWIEFNDPPSARTSHLRLCPAGRTLGVQPIRRFGRVPKCLTTCVSVIPVAILGISAASAVCLLIRPRMMHARWSSRPSRWTRIRS